MAVLLKELLHPEPQEQNNNYSPDVECSIKKPNNSAPLTASGSVYHTVLCVCRCSLLFLVEAIPFADQQTAGVQPFENTGLADARESRPAISCTCICICLHCFNMKRTRAHTHTHLAARPRCCTMVAFPCLSRPCLYLAPSFQLKKSSLREVI